MEDTTAPVRLHVTPWVDAVVDTLGEDPRSPYVERFWLPVIGPTATLLLRHLAGRFDHEPDGFAIDPVETARLLGVASIRSGGGSLHKVLQRCERFGFVRPFGPEVLAVRRRLAPLPSSKVARLPPALAAAHTRWQDEQRARAAHPSRLAHATRLARSLLDVGATLAEIDEQLERWHFDVAIRRAACAAATPVDDVATSAS